MGVRTNQRRKAALAAVQREQIVEGFAAAIAAKGYQATTITDIVANARVSKTTFYEHFADKEAVFLALHAAVAEATSAAIARRHRETAELRDWRARLRHVVDGYLEAIADNPSYLVQVIAEAAVASPATRAAREEALDRFASLMTTAVGELARTKSSVPPLSHDLAVATVAGILELVGRAAQRGPDAVRALGPSVSEIIARAVGAGARQRTGPRNDASAARPPAPRGSGAARRRRTRDSAKRSTR